MIKIEHQHVSSKTFEASKTEKKCSEQAQQSEAGNCEIASN